MRWGRFEADGQVKYGIVREDEAELVVGSPFAGYESTGNRRPLDSLRLLVPVEPRTFYAAGLNYLDHIREQAASRGREPDVPRQADIGYRANNALIAHGRPIVIPRDSEGPVEYEAELVAVIGRRAKNLAPEDALSAVLGFTIGNDVSERAWQRADRTLWRAKNTDTFKPMGPWIETDADLDALETIVRVNDRETIRFRTNDMLFPVETFLSRMSRYLTLYPGDVVWMGTEGKSPALRPGDRVDVEITGIGVLSNPVAAEGPGG